MTEYHDTWRDEKFSKASLNGTEYGERLGLTDLGGRHRSSAAARSKESVTEHGELVRSLTYRSIDDFLDGSHVYS
jgi:hypothetical protein